MCKNINIGEYNQPDVNRLNGVGVEEVSLECPFKNEDLDVFFDTDDGNLDPSYNSISKERLIEILNKITKESEGKDLLNALRIALKEENQKISFITFQGEKSLKEYNDIYAFNSDCSLSLDKIVITIKNEPEELIKRFAFDGQEIIECSVKNIDPESYFISHELAHVVSFLKSGVIRMSEKNDAWTKRKENWDVFLESKRMEPIKNALLEADFVGEKISSCFEKFFKNTEEARNLLGFETETTPKFLIGEFCLFNKKDNYSLPIYFEKSTKLSDEEIIFLKTIGEKLGIHFQRGNSFCAIL